MSFAAMSRARFWSMLSKATRHWQVLPRLEVLLPANFALTPGRIAPGKNQPLPRTNRITQKIRMAITAVNTKAAPTRIAIWLKLRSSSDWWPDIDRQPFDGFRFQGI